MTLQRNRVLRVVELLWRRMGAARFYFLAAVIVILGLALVGAFYIINGRKPPLAGAPAPVAISSSPGAASPTPTNRRADAASKSLPDPTERPVSRPLLAITDVVPQERFNAHGSSGLELIVGITPQADVRSRAVEIRVSFFEATPTGEIRPTDAAIKHRWLNGERDWSQPTPKYLLVSYAPRDGGRAGEELRYAGYLVRAYLDGELQDQRAVPDSILKTVGLAGQRRDTAMSAPSLAGSRPSLPPASPVPPSATATASPVDGNSLAAATPADSTALPYGRPVPDKPGFVNSPYDERFLIDVRGMPPGTLVKDPHTGKSFLVP